MYGAIKPLVNKTQLLFISFALVVMLLQSACDSSSDIENSPCPPYDNVPISPYNDPIWHPNGNIIGFNHIPIKEIHYVNGFHCPHQAVYIYEEDSAGFWLINSDGSNMRRVLPFSLNTPTWSPDGEWIAFNQGAQIYKMPFDGESFDTTMLVQLTLEGRNFFPAWSPDSQLVAYDNTDCGSATTPIPPNSCGVLIITANGTDNKFIGPGRYPYWGNTKDYLFSGGIKYDLINNTSEVFFDARDFGISVRSPVRFNYSATTIAFIGNYTDAPTQFPKLFSINPDGENLKAISDNNIINFSWSPDDRIVYVDFDYSRIDRQKGALWIMDAHGKNQKQLSFNEFITR